MSTASSPNWQDQQDPELLAQLAINAALTSNWMEAAKINQKILTISTDNVEALNRLARAQTCSGEIDKAQKTYKKVLELDPYNLIAKKNYEKISKLSTNDASKNHSNNTDVFASVNTINLTTVFLFEPGKTKTLNLLNLASPSILAGLNCGQQVNLVAKKHSVTITNGQGTYLGALPDDISHRILFYLEGGNKYEVFVKYATTKSLTIFIRETERSAKFVNQPSFQESKSAMETDS